MNNTIENDFLDSQGKVATSDPNNFRPISLTATCCKVMERIVNDILLRYPLDRRLISKQQHGFIRRRSVCTNLLDCLEAVSYTHLTLPTIYSV